MDSDVAPERGLSLFITFSSLYMEMVKWSKDDLYPRSMSPYCCCLNLLRFSRERYAVSVAGIQVHQPTVDGVDGQRFKEATRNAGEPDFPRKRRRRDGHSRHRRYRLH